MKRTSEQRAKAKANAKPSQQKHMHILHTQNALKSIAKKKIIKQEEHQLKKYKEKCCLEFVEKAGKQW